MGLWDYFAPRKKSMNKNIDQISRDELMARKLQQEAEEAERKRRQKQREDETQRKLEMEAETKGMFAKRQNVIYYHKGSNKKYYSQIIGVHFDDGPDRPYYTIKYEKIEKYFDDKGIEQTQVHVIEKQTTPDRLIRISKHEEGREVMISESKGSNSFPAEI